MKASRELSANKNFQVSDAERSLIKQSKVAIPFPHPQPPKDAKYTLEYAKPTVMNPIGSYPLKLNARTVKEQAIDLAVVMPPTLFQEKDYLNYRYFYKKAYYVACLAAGIKATKGHNFQLKFDHLDGNELHPIVVVKGKGQEADLSGSKYRIHIIPVAPDGVFPEDKTIPEKNCIRPKQTGETPAQTALKPTPFYNASIRGDSQATSYLKLLRGALSRTEAFRDACLLGGTWLRQRGFGSHVRNGGFGNFEWAAIMALLLQGGGPAGKPLFAAGYSSYQLFKGMLQYLATRDLVEQPHLYQAPGVQIPREDGAPTFFDGLRGMNILYKMMPWAYYLLRREARTTVAALGENAFDQFDSTFVLRSDHPLYRFDVLTEVPVSALGIDLQDDDYTQKLVKSYQKLYRALKRGLGDRAQLISLILPESYPWPLGSAKTTVSRDARILVGFVVDPANVGRSVDHGPAAESKKEAAAFRQFWGERAELRRFKDGSILESLVWSTKDSSASIFEQIVRYVLSRHMGKDVADSTTFFGERFSHLLAGSGQAGTDLFLPFRKAFDTLERDIRTLEGMPLAARHVFAADPQLRYTSVDIPLANRQNVAVPANVVIEFEGSARWPDDIKAIQMTKVAFLLKLGELLQEGVEGVTTRVGLENEGLDLMNQAFLDVTYPTGAAFRLRIHHDREQTLLERRLKDKSLDATSKEAAALALATYKRESRRVPAHTQALQALCTRLPALSPSIRLLKKWFSDHLLSTHFTPELIELMVVRTFLNSYPWEPPTSAMTGFLRTLSFLARWDWRNEPLTVDFGGSMKPEEASAVTTRYEAWRKIDPALNRVVIFAATNIDTEGTTWTDHARPAKVVAARMSALAKAAAQTVRDQGIAIEPASLFASPLADYDFVLRINPAYTKFSHGKKNKSTKQQFRNLVLQTEAVEQGSTNLAGFDPVKLLLAELRDTFGHTIIFFFQEGEGDVITGLWNPATTAKRKWKVRMGYSTIPVSGKNGDAEVDAEINKEGILAEMARLGGDLVKKIDVNRR